MEIPAGVRVSRSRKCSVKRTRDGVRTLMPCTKTLKVTQRHNFTKPRIRKFDIDEQKLRCKEGIFLSESVAEQPAHWKGGFNLLCPLSCYTEFSCILKQGYLQQTQRQKQKAQKKSSVSVLLQTAPGQLERSGTIKHDRTLTAN